MASLSHIRRGFAKLGTAGSVTLALPHSIHHLPSNALHKPSTANVPQHPHTAVITLRNAARKNSLTPSMMAQLADTIDLLEAVVCERTAHDRHGFPLIGVVIQGEGATFCSGFDLSLAGESFMNPESGNEMALLMHDTLSRLRRLPLISVAAVQGHAIGGGAELCASCDLRVIDEQAKIQFVQTRMGVAPGWGGASRLASLLGRSRALNILASSKSFTGRDCYKIGLADEIAVLPATAPETSIKLLELWATEGFPDAIRAVKMQVHNADEFGLGEDDKLSRERQIFASLWGGPSNKEALGRRKRTKE